MILHNCYTLRTKNKTVTAYNALASDFWVKAAAYPHWAEWFALTEEDGTRKTAAAQLTFLNCDPQRGGVLRAVYAATVDCAPGKRFVSVSLESTEGGGNAMSTAQIDYESDGETLEIRAVIFLQIEGADQNILLCGGDNALVRRLLGCGSQCTFTVAGGTCRYPSRVCKRTSELTGAPLAVQAEWSGNGVTFSANAPSDGNEVLLLADGVPVVRALRSVGYTIETVSRTVGSECALLLANHYPLTVSTLRLNNTSVLRYDTCRVCDTLVSVRSGDEENLGADGQVKTDPSETYLAVITSAYVDLYEVDSLDRKHLLRVPRTVEHVHVCRGGVLVIWGSSSIILYEPDENGVYQSFSYNIPRGTGNVIVREGNIYHGIYARSNVLYRFTLSKTSAPVLIEQFRATSGLVFYGRCGDALFYGDKTIKVVTSTVDVTAEFACDAVGSSTATRTMLSAGECFFVATQGGVTRLYDLVHNTSTVIAADSKVNGRLIINGSGVFVYDYYNGLHKLSGGNTLDGVTSACLAGDGVFAVRKNKMSTYYRNGDAMAVRLPVTSEGKTATCNVREQTVTGLGRPVRFGIVNA